MIAGCGVQVVAGVRQAGQVILIFSQAGEAPNQSKKERELPEKSVDVGDFAGVTLSSRGRVGGLSQRR